MNPDDSHHPVYAGLPLPSPKRVPFGRRYGKYNFDRFQSVKAGSHSLGSGLIGEMEVECKFVFSESRWGVLGSSQDPAGVVYLNLKFTEPPGCLLRGATVTLTLNEYDEDLRAHFHVTNSNEAGSGIMPVHIVSHGPGELTGQLTRVAEYQRSCFTPNVGVMGIAEFGGIGKESSRQRIAQSQWRFTSQTQSDHRGCETKLRWDLSENELDKSSKHSNTIHTAFAFRHDGQPFLMQLDVQGKLRSRTSNLKHTTKKKFQKLKFSPRNQMNAVTLINFGGRNNSRYGKPLDELAGGLPQLMIEKNMTGYGHGEPGHMEPKIRYDALVEEEDDDASSISEILFQRGRSDDALEVEEVRETALALMSLNHGVETGFAPKMTGSPNLPDHHLTDSSSLSSTETSSSQTVVDIQPDDELKVVRKNRGLADQEEVQKLFEDLGVPVVFRILIVWLFILGSKQPFKKK